MTSETRPAYLFLLPEPSLDARQELSRRLREAGATVVAEYGDEAVEALATEQHVEAVRGRSSGGAREGRAGWTGVVALRGAMSREHLERLPERTRAVVELWNRRFTPAARRAKLDRTEQGRSWGSEDRDPPLPHSAIDPAAFLELVRRVERERDVRLLPEEEPDQSDGAGPTELPVPGVDDHAGVHAVRAAAGQALQQ